MKGYIEAFITMYLALFSKFLQEVLNKSGIDMNVVEAELESLLKIFIKIAYDNFAEHLNSGGASRQCFWTLRLYSLDNFVKYFFAHDQLIYERMTPVYVVTIAVLESEGVLTWNYIKQNFSISKKFLCCDLF